MDRIYNQLPQVAFSILLALSLKPRHGYEIMKQVEEDSNGKIKLAPGTLYGSIKQLREQGLVRELEGTNGDRRRSYCLTDKGLRALTEELEYYNASVQLARYRQILQVGM